MFDVASAAAAGVDLPRLLWIRGHAVSHPGLCRDMNGRALEQAIRALTLVLGAGNFGLVIFDAADAPADALRRLPFTTWLRLQRLIEGAPTVCVLVGAEPMARSSAGLTVQLTQTAIPPAATVAASRLFEGFEMNLRVVRARAHTREDVRVALAARVAAHE